jgi:hyperosmotically inducible protein
MKARFVLACVVWGALLGSAAAMGDDDLNSAGSNAVAFVKDSAITTEIKSKLAAEHLTSLERIHVDTDKNGIVWLFGTARSKEAADKAESIARATAGVKDVHGQITVSNAE